MDLTPQITALQSQVDALGRQIAEKEEEGEVLVVRSSFLSSRLHFCVEIFFFFFFVRHKLKAKPPNWSRLKAIVCITRIMKLLRRPSVVALMKQLVK